MNEREKLYLNAIFEEYIKATNKFNNFASTHEGIAVLREEYLELLKEIFRNQSQYDINKMRKEAIQVGAMALRFIIDCC